MKLDHNWMRRRFCDRQFLKWRTNKSGQRVSGFRWLRDHIADAHIDEMIKLEDALGPMDEDWEAASNG